MDRKVEISVLLDLYGKLLTEKQFFLLNDYYNQDLSLSEIAENENITRQAVRDNLKKGEKKLFEFEEKLGIMKKTLVQNEKIAVILSKIARIKDDASDKEISKILEDVKSELNSLL